MPSVKNRLSVMMLSAALLAILTACTSSNAIDADPTADSGTPAASGPVEDGVPSDFVAASSEALPGVDAATSYEQAQLTCIILSNVDGDHDEAKSLLQSEVALPVEDAKTYLRLATAFVCPDLA
jgi:hypothetical protein